MRNLLLLLIPLYLGFHLFTLSRYPLPNYAESVIASVVTQMEKEGITQILQPHTLAQKQVLSSSPFVLYTNTIILSYLDNFLFSHRVINLVFSFILILLLLYYFTNFERGSFKNASILFIGAFILDTTFCTTFHGNGAAICAITFFLISLRKELIEEEDYTFYSTLTSAFWMTFALFSYFPIIIFLPFVLIFKIAFAISYIQQRQFSYAYHLIFWPLLIVIFYLPWLIYFDINLNSLFSSAFQLNYFWSKLPSLPISCIVLIVATLLLLLFSMIQNKYEIERKKNIFLLTGIILSFFLLNNKWEKDIILLLPLFYLLIFSLLPLNLTTEQARYGRYTPITILLLLNGFLFLLQFIYIMADFNNRSGRDLKNFVSSYIPENVEVMGDGRPGFTLLENKNKYYTLKSTLELNEKIRHTNANYVIISNEFEDNDRYAAQTLEYYHFKKIAEIKYTSSNICQLFSNVHLFTRDENNLYTSVVYKKEALK